MVAAVARGEEVQVATAGRMAVHGQPMKRDTLFRIASMTKPVTAAAVFSLVDKGVIGLDVSAEGLLPQLAHRRVLTRPNSPLGDTVTRLGRDRDRSSSAPNRIRGDTDRQDHADQHQDSSADRRGWAIPGAGPDVQQLHL